MMGTGSADQLTAILGLMSDPQAAEKRLKDITAAEDRLSKLQVEANNDIESAKVAMDEAARAVEQASRDTAKAETANREAEAANRQAKSEKQAAEILAAERSTEIDRLTGILNKREEDLEQREAVLQEGQDAVESEHRHTKGLAEELKAKGVALKNAVKAIEDMNL